MIIYNLSRQSVTLSGTTPLLTVVPGSVRSFLILEIDVQGMGNASGANELAIYRVLAAGTGTATAIANAPASVDSPNMTGTTPAIAFSGSANASYGTTQPTLSSLLHNLPVNSNGQRYFWRANANLNNAIVTYGGSFGLTVAPISGTGVVSIRLQVAEL
jgi:hypothetical protein